MPPHIRNMQGANDSADSMRALGNFRKRKKLRLLNSTFSFQKILPTENKNPKSWQEMQDNPRKPSFLTEGWNFWSLWLVEEICLKMIWKTLQIIFGIFHLWLTYHLTYFDSNSILNFFRGALNTDWFSCIMLLGRFSCRFYFFAWHSRETKKI